MSRKKIDSIIKKNQPVYDEDAPDCPESVRFWCFTSGQMTGKERVSITGQARVHTRATAEGVGSLLEISGDGAGPVSASAPTLQAIVGAMNADTPAPNESAAEKKEKTKKDKKDKKPKKEEPTTTKEKKAAARDFLYASGFNLFCSGNFVGCWYEIDSFL